MSPHSEATHREWQAKLAPIGQEHVLRFWPELDDSQRGQLVADLQALNLAELPSYSRIASNPPAVHGVERLEPAPIIRMRDLEAGVAEKGRELLRQGKVAAFTVAGGQGTRLGFNGPKGAFAISPVRNKPLFQLFAESILAAGRLYGRPVRWYIMTSPANDAQTREFFGAHRFFGLSPSDVQFFEQGVMPAFDRAGKILLEEKHRIALSPDGHGGSLLALARTGMLADMAAHGVEHISYFQVDNPLVACVDPAFIGLHAMRRSEMSSKTLPKADDLERVGNFVMASGRLAIIEYSDLPEALARAKNPDGSRRFDAANIAIHLLSRAFVERLTADPAAFALPWHRAEKKVPCIDLASGHRVEPGQPNGIKLESFVFDALPLADHAILLETSREEEFSPVKNATGVDSVDTARRDLSRRAARWLKAAGWSIPTLADGEPDGLFEISPLAASDLAILKQRGLAPWKIFPGDAFYLAE